MVFLVLRFTEKHSLTPAAQNAPTAAARAVCDVAVSALNQAVTAYQQLNGKLPPPGRAWAITSTNGTPWLQTWPGVAHEFTITWTGHHMVVATPHGAGCNKA